MPDITIDEMLIVAAEIRLVALDDQPARQKLIDSLSEPDQRIMQELTKLSDPTATLKDYLLLRAKELPTQSLEEIIKLLTDKKPFEIDRDHLLVNLIHAQQIGFIAAEEIAILMRIYVTLTAIADQDPTLKSVQFVDCLIGNKPEITASLNPIIREAIKDGAMLNESKLQNMEWLRIKTPRYPILQQAIAFTHEAYNDPLAPVRLGGNKVIKKGESESVIYTLPLPILSAIYSQTCNEKDHSVEALPLFGCYSFKHLREYSCRSEGEIEYRPVTLPTYLPKDIRGLFYGARANGFAEVVYDLYSADPDLTKHFLDMQRAHGNRVGYFGVMNHDDFHTFKANSIEKSEARLKNQLVDALEECQLETPAAAAVYNLYHALLDDGIVGFLSESLQRNKDNFEIFEKVISKISTPDFKELLLNAILKWTKSPDLSVLQKHFGSKGSKVVEFLQGATNSLNKN